ncbi:hypothetical protein BU25DRAFT_178890 [Macroventuria anomochaeta]|uniref:Uncharacterized protein n=1 Tax=Macroventuria anomochaeta TaxID=301207 RepID=A0ACB6RQ81_9PLEO|nr:uncharacterized protein BU25DRAFT_178890 [Macroventuria anomochaeta]KAF2623427.1 hypothetical protein BU25DRAFT_178890 [Macroventuria anomochaeta]
MSARLSMLFARTRLWTPHLARTRRPHRLRTLLRRSFGPRTHEGGSTPATVSLLVLSFAGLLQTPCPIPTCPRFDRLTAIPLLSPCLFRFTRAYRFLFPLRPRISVFMPVLL